MHDKPTCQVIKATTAHTAQHGLAYFNGLSAETVGAQKLCMHLIHIPPAARAQAHKHANHETMIYVLSGESGMWYGEQLEQYLTASAGEFLYIPADMPHLPINLSATEPCVAIIARTDPNAEESIILLPQLEANHKG